LTYFVTDVRVIDTVMPGPQDREVVPVVKLMEHIHTTHVIGELIQS